VTDVDAWWDTVFASPPRTILEPAQSWQTLELGTGCAPDVWLETVVLSAILPT